MQTPLQRALVLAIVVLNAAFNRSGYSPELMWRLLRTDWIRKAADAVRLAATAILFLEKKCRLASLPLDTIALILL